MKHDPNKTVLGTFSNGAICYSYQSKYNGCPLYSINEPAKGLPYGLEVELTNDASPAGMIDYYCDHAGVTYKESTND